MKAETKSSDRKNNLFRAFMELFRIQRLLLIQFKKIRSLACKCDGN